MISWKYSFDVLRRELELVKKKKEALDSLFNAGRISRSTFDYLNKDLAEAITGVEGDQKKLTGKMASRANELDSQLKSLEIFLANLEIHYAAGEIGEEAYKHQGNAIALGLEATKQELKNIKGALIQLIPKEAPISLAPAPPTPTEAVHAEEKVEGSAEVTAEGLAEVSQTATE